MHLYAFSSFSQTAKAGCRAKSDLVLVLAPAPENRSIITIGKLLISPGYLQGVASNAAYRALQKATLVEPDFSIQKM
jgi:hypothetical protein